MNALELARQRAAELHDDAVARGQDPTQPYDFASAEAIRQGFRVRPKVPGHSLLNKAEARISHEDELLFHANDGTPFRQAFLIAHELGHVELGDHPSDSVAASIDPARSAEPPPVGTGRVVDYGPRQRREIQMDLFAREFLLPRTVVRRLHVEEQLSAAAIAARFGAPYDVVSQQLLDALFLPPWDKDTEAVPRPLTLNREQQEAATYQGGPYILEAGPGTGKTQTLTARIEHLLSQGIDAKAILVLTYSNKAAFELVQRIGNSRPQEAAAIWIGTFHAFGLDLIHRFYKAMGFKKDPRLLEKAEAASLLADMFPRMSLVHYRDLYDPTPHILDLLKAISRAKDEVVDAPSFAQLADQMVHQPASNKKALDRALRAYDEATFYASYEALKRDANAIDFGDLLMLPVHLLEAQPEIAADLSKTYRHILVDEYQDVNHSSVRLLKALRPSGENIWVVGDSRQAIYRFRGASSENMARFASQDFPDAHQGRLRRNYRSRAEIVDAFCSFASQMQVSSGESQLEAVCGTSNKPPEHHRMPDQRHHSGVLADSISALQEQEFSFRDQALLCTRNDRIAALADELEKRGVPVLYLGNLFDRPDIKVLLALLSLVTDAWGGGLVRVACLDKFALSLEDVEAIMLAVKERDCTWRELANLGLPALSPESNQALKELGQALEGFNSHSSPWQILSAVLFDHTRMAAALAASSSPSAWNRRIAYWQFMNFVRSQPQAHERGAVIVLLEQIRHLVKLQEDRELRKCPAVAEGLNAIRLMTIHQAKGLEFPVIHLPELNDGSLPSRQMSNKCPPLEGMLPGELSVDQHLKRDHIQEQECQFYVALSRAQERLLLYSNKLNAYEEIWEASRYIQHLGTGLKRVDTNASKPLPRRSERPLSLLSKQTSSFQASQVSLYAQCPRRFFYTHILGIGGRRNPTAFLQMHLAVRAVFKAVIHDALAPTPAALQARLKEAFQEQGLTGHGYAADYYKLAWKLLQNYLSSRDIHQLEAPQTLTLNLGSERLLVQADEVLITAEKQRIFRLIHTGHRPEKDADDTVSLVLWKAATLAFPNARVEQVYLADQKSFPVSMYPSQAIRRLRNLEERLARIRAGHFPRSQSKQCASCPAFFVCGPLPASRS